MNYLLLTFAVSAFSFFSDTAYATSARMESIMQPTTLHHCGYLPTTQARYATSKATVRVIERKLRTLGYHPIADGRYGATDRRAIRRFQASHGLAVDGIVGPRTTQKLAYASHPSDQVRRCAQLSRR